MKKILYLIIAITGLHLKITSQTITINGGTLTIQNNGTITADGNLTIDGTGTVQNDGTINAKGNVVNNFTNSTTTLGNWVLNGTTNQAISGSTNMLVNNLTVDNTAGVTINKIVKVNGALTFNNGIITASSATNPLILGAAATIPTTPSNAKHVDGFVVKEGTANFTFPTGNGSIYQPVGLNTIASNTNGILAKYFVGNSGGANGALDSYNTGEYWDLSPFNGGTANSKVVIYWDGTNDASAIQLLDRKVGHLVGGSMLNHGGSATGSPAAGSVVSSDAITSWSPFVLGFKTATALPLSLLSFSAKIQGEINALNWETANEINVSHFEIERSDDASFFKQIGKLDSKNLAKEAKTNYDFSDYSPIIGSNYYRLKILDLDNKFTYSKIINLYNYEKNEVVGNFYPNPATGKSINIDVTARESGEWNISKFDLTGKLLKSETKYLEKGVNKLVLNEEATGELIYKFSNKSTNESRKVIKR
jgi:hypothetical protein